MSRQAFRGVPLTIVISKIRQLFKFFSVTLDSVRINSEVILGIYLGIIQ